MTSRVAVLLLGLLPVAGAADFSFLFDGYVNRNFNLGADSAHFDMGMMTIDQAPAPVGFHLDTGFGQAFNLIHATDKAPDELKYIQQAYVDFKPKSWHGVELDAGEFWSSAGAEVIPTNQDWNYSRSLLFVWAVPYYHFGVRASFPIGAHFTGGVQVVQGWNNVKDNNSGKTIGLNGAYAWKKVAWTNVYYGGPEKDHTNQGLRHLYDTTVLIKPSDKTSYYVNFDYGRDKNIGPGASQWTGIAAAARFAVAKKFAIAPRLEWFDDMDGLLTGTPQSIKECTLTGEYKVTDWLLSRLEFRNDWSPRKSQPAVLLGMIVFFSPK